MIVPMKHVTVFALEKARTQAARDLEGLGMVHVTTLAGTSVDLEILRGQQTRIQRALAILDDGKTWKATGPAPQVKTMEEALEMVIASGEGMKSDRDNIEKIRSELERIAPLGSFKVEDLALLAERGMAARFAGIPESDIRKSGVPEGFLPISSGRGRTFFLVLDGAVAMDPSWEVLTAPEHSPVELRVRMEALQESLGQHRSRIASLATSRGILEQRQKELDHEVEFARVEDGMACDGPLVMIQGYIPADAVGSCKTWASRHGWGVCFRDPEPEEVVPTILKNPPAVAILRPVLDFLGTLPGYRERDISPWFLLFLTIFFAMIIGDAAYGTLFLVIGLIASVRSLVKFGKIPPILVLLMVFSIATMAWGAMSGSWLALEGAADVPLLKALMVPALANPETNKLTVLLVCFLLGLVHLNIAHLLRFIKEIRQAPHVHALAQLGWAMVVNGAFFLVLNVVVDPVMFPVPDFSLWFMGGGMVTVLVFEKQEGDGFIKGILRSLAGIISTSLSGVSAFADIISYVRLYAVGLAGVAIEQSFNAMALPMFKEGGMVLVAGGLILFLGHSLNLVMGALSVIVHGIRLNMLEFSSHTGLEWTGIPYQPFKSGS